MEYAYIIRLIKRSQIPVHCKDKWEWNWDGGQTNEKHKKNYV